LNTRIRRSMLGPCRVPMLAIGVWLVIASVASADVIALKSGEQLRGVIANRARVRARLNEQSELAIFLENSSEFHRVSMVDVEFVVFADEDSREVFDVTALTVEPLPVGRDVPRVFRDPSEPPSGFGFMAAGAVMAGVGAFVKFGGAKATVTEGSVDIADKSYNAANYVLMVGGGIFMVLGVTMEARRSGDAESHATIGVDPCLSPISGDAAVALRLLF